MNEAAIVLWASECRKVACRGVGTGSEHAMQRIPDYDDLFSLTGAAPLTEPNKILGGATGPKDGQVRIHV